MGIIDFHTHPYPGPAQCFAFYPNMAPLTPEAMRQQLLGAGITHICGSVLNQDRSFSLRGLNDAALQLRDLLGDFYTPGFHVHPDCIDNSLAEIERMQAGGVNLIGELVPYMHGWGKFAERPCIEELTPILDLAEKYHMVFSFHTMWDWPLDELIASHPGVTFVAAHPGERDSVARHIERMKKFDNVYLDLSGTGIFRFGCIRYLVDQVGAERILFGTDYPICNPEMYVHAVLGEQLGSRAEQLIFHDNAAHLLGLED